jgi:hypothetical protein
MYLAITSAYVPKSQRAPTPEKKRFIGVTLLWLVSFSLLGAI